jgi:hypothetical protein
MAGSRIDALDPSPFGLNLHTAAHLAPLFAGIGIRWHRIDIDWDRVEPERGQLRWDETDRIMEAADDLGLSALGSVAYTPEWASDPSRHPGLDAEGVRALPPVDHQNFVAFLVQVVERYAGRLQAISVWNEPDFDRFWRGTLADYIALLGPALRAVRQAAPGLVTCGPDLSKWEKAKWWHIFKPSRPRRWMKAILAATERGAGGEPLLDVITHHQYAADDIPQRRVELIEDLHRFVSSRSGVRRPLWITETGWATDKVSLEEQARHLQTIMASMAARDWWTKTFWYDSHGTEDRAEWGLLAPAEAPEVGQRRPAFLAYEAVIADAGGTPPMSRDEAEWRAELAYEAILGRRADPEGLAVHATVVRRHSTVEACEGLLSSTEFDRRLGHDGVEQVGTGFFTATRGHPPSEDEREAAVSAIQGGQAAPFVAALIDAAPRRA